AVRAGSSLPAPGHGAGGDRLSRSHPERRPPDETHPANVAARRAGRQRGRHPARHPDSGAAAPASRRAGHMTPVYLDYAATSPADPRVAAAMSECLTRDGVFGNPSSMHQHGRLARERVEQARAQAAALIHAPPQQLVWTSGATESNNLAILGTARASARRGRHLITARTEHKSVLDPCHRLEHEGFQVTYLDT